MNIKVTAFTVSEKSIYTISAKARVVSSRFDAQTHKPNNKFCILIASIILFT